ncbi:MAG: metallophosphoesterase [Acutalibacteraceae bacterium]|nr:metallophosphoesterase [Acutalibacteraceae bacterium]
MFFITGDTHGDFTRLHKFCNIVQPSAEDVLIILGDAGLNYYGGSRDKKVKARVTHKYPITLFCIHGNHEMRPWETGLPYKEKEFCGGTVYYEELFPHILFAKDGEIYNFPTSDGIKSCLVIGGAYSVDKFYRLVKGYSWFESEQPSDDIKKYVEDHIAKVGKKVDIVLSHTCPLKYEPTEVFLPMVDQSRVDKSTEMWLGEIEETLDYQKWYCGHFHTEKIIDKMEFMFNNIKEFK